MRKKIRSSSFGVAPRRLQSTEPELTAGTGNVPLEGLRQGRGRWQVWEASSSQRSSDTEDIRVEDMICRTLAGGTAGRSLFFARRPAESSKRAGVPCIDD